MAISDYELGIERAAHEVEWMKRGYVAWLMNPIQTVADAIRGVPLIAGPEGTYRQALKDATQVAVRMRDAVKNDIHMHATFNTIAERLNELPDDPLDEHHCQRKDGRLPTTSRGYKETSHA